MRTWAPRPVRALPMCPSCQREAPIVYRGAIPYCTACGALRMPLSGTAVNLAGKPAKIGGAVASVFGWLVLLAGLGTALGTGLLLYAIFSVAVALAIALPMALVVAIMGAVLVRSGHSLTRSGVDAERSVHEDALLALASHRGSVTASDAARALSVTVAEADAMLTDLAKRQPERLTVDIDDHGGVWFRALDVFGVPPAHVRVVDGVRVEPDVAAGEELEVDEAADRVGLRR